jgi:REP element-mobilizing transposase RayT
MPRPSRIDYPGCVHHVTARGNRGAPIFGDDFDRRRLLALLAEALHRFDAAAFAYCLMDNHYHLVLHSRQGNLDRLMRHVGSAYAHGFNRRHASGGHLFQDRFHSRVVDSDNYLLRVCCYVELNPVRAGMVRWESEWPWSSHRAHLGHETPPSWLDVGALHAHLLGRDPLDAEDRALAAQRYAAAIAASGDDKLWRDGVRQEGFLGDDQFVERAKSLAASRRGRQPNSGSGLKT